MKKRKKKLKPFKAWVIADGDYMAGPTRYSQMLVFGDRGGAMDQILGPLRKDVPWEPVQVRCVPIYPKKRRSKKP